MNAGYLVRRVLVFFVVMWAAMTLIFFLPKLAPGRDPIQERMAMLAATGGANSANIAEMVQAATGINLWAEWARVEVADARGEKYAVPKAREDFAGVLISLARQDWPDTSAYNDPEIVTRLRRLHHAGLVVASPSAKRVQQLLNDYMGRFLTDFHASLPASETPSA